VLRSKQAVLSRRIQARLRDRIERCAVLHPERLCVGFELFTDRYLPGFNLVRCGMLLVCTGLLISPEHEEEGNKLMFLSEWREFPSAPCLAWSWGGGTCWQLASRCC